jgi:hypothetical protein
VAKAAALTVTLLTLSGAFGTSTAKAHNLHRYKGESAQHFSNRLVWHAKTGIRWIKTHPQNFKTYRRYRQALRNHRWLLRYGKSLQPRIVSLAIPPHYWDWLCIHRYEGAWNDPGAPYYGGLQMDWGFMHAYGNSLLRSKGTADHWTPLEQMWVAEKALQAGRGFYPWPNTARMCGLI